MLSVTINSIMLSVIMLNVITLNVVVPVYFAQHFKTCLIFAV